MIARALIVSLFVLAVAFAASPPKPKKNNTQDIVHCNTKPGDVELTNVQVVDAGHYLGKVGINFVYPPESVTANNVINCIVIRDMKPELGATVEITNGTIGDSRVYIQMSSTFSKGVSYSIQLLGQLKKK